MASPKTAAEPRAIDPMEQLAADARASGSEIVLATGKVTHLVINEDMWRFADGLCKANMVPKGLTAQPGAILGIVQAGAEIGMPPMAALSAITFINGRLGIMGAPSRALVRSRGALKSGSQIKLRVEGDTKKPRKDWDDDVTGIAWCWPKGYDEPVEYRFSVLMAKRAGLWGKTGPWSDYPDRMLMERAWGFVFRDHFGEHFTGLTTTEEANDIEERIDRARDVTSVVVESGPGTVDPLLAGAPARELEVVGEEEPAQVEQEREEGPRAQEEPAAPAPVVPSDGDEPRLF